MALKSLDLVVLGVPAARSNLLIVLQMLDVALLQKAFREIGHLDPRTRLNLGLGQDYSPLIRPVTCRPAALGLALRGGLGVAQVDRTERVGLH